MATISTAISSPGYQTLLDAILAAVDICNQPGKSSPTEKARSVGGFALAVLWRLETIATRRGISAAPGADHAAAPGAEGLTRTQSTSIRARWPWARASRRSRVTSGASRASASATYMAS